MALPDEKLRALYERMVMVRTMEKTHERLLAQGKIQLMGHYRHRTGGGRHRRDRAASDGGHPVRHPPGCGGVSSERG